VTAAALFDRRFALLDRDGTIIIDKIYLSDPKDIEFAPFAIEGLRLLRDAGARLILLTNQ
jgi:D-glycero-D-manno-heptose 1,7-bisphosphate phosphatase